MGAVACSIYSLFISSILGTSLGIATLVLAIVFSYIGFVDSSISQPSCTDSYLLSKYTYLSLQLQTSFVGICVGLFSNLIGLILMILTLKNFRNFRNQQNPQKAEETLPLQVLSKARYGFLYAILSLGNLGNIVCFGSYLTFFLQGQRDSSVCSITYDYTNLLILVIVSGAWLLSFIMIQIITLKINSHYVQDQIQQQKRNKYIEMVNLTQQPQTLQEIKQKRKQQQFFANNAFVNEMRSDHQQNNVAPNVSRINNTQGYLKPTQSYYNPVESTSNRGNIQTQKTSLLKTLYQNEQVIQQNGRQYPKRQDNQKKQTFQQYKQRQAQQSLIEQQKQQQKQQYYQATRNPFEDVKSPGQQRIGSRSNKIYQPQSYGNYINNNNKNYKSNFDGNNNQQLVYRKPINQEKSPIRILNENGQESRYYQNRDSPKEAVKMFQRSPAQQRTLNSNVVNKSPNRYNQKYNEDAQQSKGNLIFHKKPFDSNQPSNYISSGEVSFKSPGRFDTKFAQEERDYLQKNTLQRVLPNGGVRQASPNRKRIFDEGSGYNNSPQSQSRNQQFSPSQSRSRTKSREGVLTSFIRGKFSGYN